QLDWRSNQQLLVVNYVNGRIVRRPKRESGLLCKLADRPSDISMLGDLVPQRGTELREHTLKTTIEDLCQQGVIMICRSGDQVKTHVPDYVGAG
ncbi:MAG TPA: hypothetical protein VGH74_09510, partial [Planctomycetaceae bacterium]